jgi:hypothetical protein
MQHNKREIPESLRAEHPTDTCPFAKRQTYFDEQTTQSLRRIRTVHLT